MTLQRLPVAPLRPFVSLLWSAGEAGGTHFAQPQREHVLPLGAMHVVIRLNDAPLCLLKVDSDACDQRLDGALVGGARSRYYVRELHAPSCSVGLMLRPGAGELLFGVGAHELAERHTPLDDLWGAEAGRLRERLLELRTTEERLALLEAALAARLPRARALHPGIAAALAALPSVQSVQVAVRHSGFSHRRFIDHFRRAVGLTPKSYLRVLRFQQALGALRGGKRSLADVAAEAGYSDQAHFNRDFREFAGVTPAEYRRRMPAEANHLPARAASGVGHQVSSRREAARP